MLRMSVNIVHDENMYMSVYIVNDEKCLYISAPLDLSLNMKSFTVAKQYSQFQQVQTQYPR